MSAVPKIVSGRRELDVSGLPTVVFGHTNVSWLGNVFYMIIEGVMFAMVVASYFYLRTRSSEWPPNGIPPSLRYGVASAILFVVSIIPAVWVQKQARQGNRTNTRIGLIVLALFGVGAIVLRAFEFSALNCRWDSNAYASLIWVLIGVHTGHLITEWIETAVLTGVSFTAAMQGTRFVDVTLNSDYWYFVVSAGLIVDFIIYGTTRFL
jgi:cytochrome c oxidase subunit 3